VGKVQQGLTETDKGGGLNFFQLDFDWADKTLYAPKYVQWTVLNSIKDYCAKEHLIYGLRFAAAEYSQMQKQRLADDQCWYVSTLYQGHEYKATDASPLPQYILMGAENTNAALLPDNSGYSYTRLVNVFCSRFLPNDIRK